MACQLTQKGYLSRMIAVVRGDGREHLERSLAAPTRPWTRPTMSLQTPESLSKVLNGIGPVAAR